MGKNGLIQRLVKDVLENILEGEMEEHLGRNKYQRQTAIDTEDRNYRNGYSQKNLRSSFGDVDLDIPRDRKAEFEPKIVKKYETVCKNTTIEEAEWNVTGKASTVTGSFKAVSF